MTNSRLSSRLLRATVYRGSFAVEIIVDDAELLAEALSLLDPLFQVEESRDRFATDRLFRVITTRGVTAGAGVVSRHDIVGEPSRVYAVDYEAAEIRILEPLAPRWRVQHVLRLVRALYRLAAASESGAYIHAAMVSFKGAGIAFVGSKRSGKTTAMLSLLSSGADFVANDDLGVTPRNGIDWVGAGSTRTIAIRADTIRLPHIARSLDRASTMGLGHPFNTERDNNDYLYIRPGELARLFGVAASSEAHLTHVLFLIWDTDVRMPIVARLDEVEMLQRLNENLLPIVDKHSTCLSPFAAPGGEYGWGLSTLSAQVPGFTCRVGIACAEQLGNCLEGDVIRIRAMR